MTNTILWGSVGSNSHAVDTALEVACGKRQSLVHFGQAWAYGRKTDGTPNYAPFPVQPTGQHSYVKNATDGGQLVMLDWVNWDVGNKTDPAFSLDAVLAGNHDAYVHSYAQQAAAWQHPILIRFDSEMNGTWWAYGAQPKKFVQVWRKVVDIFRAEGATNVAWAWVPNYVMPPGSKDSSGAVRPMAQERLVEFYPGDDHVDWTGFDAYNESMLRTRDPSTGLPITTGYVVPWLTWDQMARGYVKPGVPPYTWLGDTYDTILSFAPTKPMVIGEFNSDDLGGDKVAWLADLLTVIPRRYPAIRALSLYNTNPDARSHWALKGGELVTFAAGVASPVYLSPSDWAPPLGTPLLAPSVTVDALPPVPWSYGAVTWAEALAEAEHVEATLQASLLDAAAELKDMTAARDASIAACAALQERFEDMRAAWQSLVTGLG